MFCSTPRGAGRRGAERESVYRIGEWRRQLLHWQELDLAERCPAKWGLIGDLAISSIGNDRDVCPIQLCF